MKFYRVVFLTEHLKTTGSQHRRLCSLLTVFPTSFISNSCNPKQLRTGLLQVNSCQNIRETAARKHRLDIASLQKYAAALPEKKYSISHQLVTQLKKHTVFVNSLRISIFHKCACSFSWYKIGWESKQETQHVDTGHKLNEHCVKDAHIRRFFWSLFSCIRTECGYLLISVFIPNIGKYGPDKTLYLDTFQAVVHETFGRRPGRCLNVFDREHFVTIWQLGLLSISLAKLKFQASGFAKPSDHFFARAPLSKCYMT